MIAWFLEGFLANFWQGRAAKERKTLHNAQAQIEDGADRRDRDKGKRSRSRKGIAKGQGRGRQRKAKGRGTEGLIGAEGKRIDRPTHEIFLIVDAKDTECAYPHPSIVIACPKNRGQNNVA